VEKDEASFGQIDRLDQGMLFILLQVRASAELWAIDEIHSVR
jgi:hypothetical protein